MGGFFGGGSQTSASPSPTASPAQERYIEQTSPYNVDMLRLQNMLAQMGVPMLQQGVGSAYQNMPGMFNPSEAERTYGQEVARVNNPLVQALSGTMGSLGQFATGAQAGAGVPGYTPPPGFTPGPPGPPFQMPQQPQPPQPQPPEPGVPGPPPNQPPSGATEPGGGSPTGGGEGGIGPAPGDPSTGGEQGGDAGDAPGGDAPGGDAGIGDAGVAGDRMRGGFGGFNPLLQLLQGGPRQTSAFGPQGMMRATPGSIPQMGVMGYAPQSAQGGGGLGGALGASQQFTGMIPGAIGGAQQRADESAATGGQVTGQGLQRMGSFFDQAQSGSAPFLQLALEEARQGRGGGPNMVDAHMLMSPLENEFKEQIMPDIEARALAAGATSGGVSNDLVKQAAGRFGSDAASMLAQNQAALMNANANLQNSATSRITGIGNVGTGLMGTAGGIGSQLGSLALGGGQLGLGAGQLGLQGGQLAEQAGQHQGQLGMQAAGQQGALASILSGLGQQGPQAQMQSDQMLRQLGIQQQQVPISLANVLLGGASGIPQSQPPFSPMTYPNSTTQGTAGSQAGSAVSSIGSILGILAMAGVLSSARFKRDIEFQDTDSYLDRARRTPLAKWNYKWEPPGSPRHTGPIVELAPKEYTMGGLAVNPVWYAGELHGALKELDRKVSFLEKALEG